MLWGMRNVDTFYLGARCLTALKTTATSPQAAISSSSPAAALQSHTDPLTFCTCAIAWLTASFIYSPSLNACWFNATQLAHICSCFDHERGISLCLRALICNCSKHNRPVSMWTRKPSLKPRNQRTKKLHEQQTGLDGLTTQAFTVKWGFFL